MKKGINKMDVADSFEKKEQNIIEKIKSNPNTPLIAAILGVVIILVSVLIWMQLSSRIFIEKSEVKAPIITLTTKSAGVLEKILVSPGDKVGKGKTVAIVSGQEINTLSEGIIISTKNTPGQVVSAADPLVRMVNPKEFRVVGALEEDKGLNEVVKGDKVIFTVDAFPSNEYVGVVDTVASSSKDTSVVFSISDKRAVKEFEVSVNFDHNAYPELKNGMSAKMWVYK